jgi:hypothetical protein
MTRPLSDWLKMDPFRRTLQEIADSDELYNPNEKTRWRQGLMSQLVICLNPFPSSILRHPLGIGRKAPRYRD